MSLNSNWELAIAENSGEVDSKNHKKEIVFNTTPLTDNIEAQLGFIPNNFNYTIGWRAIVWKEKETGEFKGLTDEEHHEFLERGTAKFTRGDSTDGGDSTDSTGVEGPTA